MAGWPWPLTSWVALIAGVELDGRDRRAQRCQPTSCSQPCHTCTPTRFQERHRWHNLESSSLMVHSRSCILWFIFGAPGIDLFCLHQRGPGLGQSVWAGWVCREMGEAGGRELRLGPGWRHRVQLSRPEKSTAKRPKSMKSSMATAHSQTAEADRSGQVWRMTMVTIRMVQRLQRTRRSGLIQGAPGWGKLFILQDRRSCSQK